MVPFDICYFDHINRSHIIARSLLNYVGCVGRVGEWVRECVGGVGRKFAGVTWVVWAYKILAWVAWVGILAWVVWVHEILAWV